MIFGLLEKMSFSGPDPLQIREAILAETYNKNKSAPKCSIQDAHQQITQAISPCRKSKCGCKGGVCKAGHCGCIKKGFKCTSACLCNKNSMANPNNVKRVVCVTYKLSFSNKYMFIHASFVLWLFQDQNSSIC